MKLLVEEIKEVEYLTEDVGGKKALYISGPFLQSEIVNRNGRKYPASIMETACKKYIAEKIANDCAWSELGHPPEPTINLDRVCARIVSLVREGNDWIGKARVLVSTPLGAIVKALIEDGGKLGVSSRGVGSLKMMEGINIVQDDYHIATAADVVADPSAPAAYVAGLMEQKDWVWNNGIVVESFVASQYETMKKAKTKELEDKAIKAFSSFIQKL